MNNISPSDNLSTKQKYDFLFYFLKWVLILLIAFFSLKLIMKPFLSDWSQNYTKKGDSYLQEKRYLNAKLCYDKALLLNKKNSAALAHKEIAIEAPRDVLVLESFYIEKGNTVESVFFEEIRELPIDETISTQKSKDLIEKGEFQLAIEAAKLSTKISSNYKDGWLYLGIANFKTAENLEISKAQKDIYFTEAKKAFLKVKSLDPENKDAADYLVEIEKK